MACIEKRTYIQAKTLTGYNLPAVPTDPNDWISIQTFMQAVKAVIEGKKPVPLPNLVLNFTATKKSGGVLLTWDEDPNSMAYNIYRGRTNDFTKAKTIYTPHDGSGSLFSFYDRYGQDAPGSPRRYWIEGFNTDLKYGPRTGPVLSAEAS